MSAGSRTLTVGARFRRSEAVPIHDPTDARSVAIRLTAFAALSLYGVLRWSTLMIPAPGWRLLGLVALALAVAGGVAPLAGRRRVPAVAIALLAVLVSLPIAGLPWEWFTHLRIKLSANEIGTGLQGLAGVLVPYSGTSHEVRLAMTLGAAVLLLDAAIVVAFAPPEAWRRDGRRLGAALPLVALAVVPSTLVRPQLPYLQGLLLFALLAMFMWGDRMRRDAAISGLVVAILAGVGGAVAAPRLDLHRALVNYRAWAGSVSRGRFDTFQWNQTYGPLHWPRTGRVVLEVHATRATYWKAEDLDWFDGKAWVAGSGAAGPSPSERAVTRWSETLAVTVRSMRTTDVIGAGFSGPPALAGDVTPGPSAGTWISVRELGPGSSYRIPVYAPNPTDAQLQAAALPPGGGYANSGLTGYRVVTLPATALRRGPAQVVFPMFGNGGSPLVMRAPKPVPDAQRFVQDSVYGRAYGLAQRLADQSPTPYAFVLAVLRYLHDGFRYSQSPPVSSYPLETFLFTHKLGYCQQFSGAMALLLRMGGLPARVATGFTTGKRIAPRTWKVSDIDAHAWVEVWFPRYGWVPFDPTPASAPELRGQPVEPIIKRLPGSQLGAKKSSATPQHALPSPISSPHGGEVRRGGGGSLLPGMGIGVALVLLAVLGAGAWRGRLVSGEPVDELERALARSGRPLPDGTTLAALEHRFRSYPEAAGYVRALRLARFAGVDVAPTAGQRRALRAQLRAGLGPTARMRALWALPPRLHSRRSRRRRPVERRGDGPSPWFGNLN